MENGSGRIEYSTKELLARIDSKLDRMDEKLDTKADRIVVDSLDKRIAYFEVQEKYRQAILDRFAGWEKRTEELVIESRTKLSIQQARRWLVPVLCSAVLGLFSIGVAVANLMKAA